MAFLKGIKGTIEYPLSIEIPVLNEKDEESVLTIKPVVQYTRFKRKDARKIQSKVARLSTDAAKALEDGNIEELFSDRLEFFDELLLEHVHGWRNMPGSEDEEVPFSKEALQEAVDDNYYFLGLMSGLRRSLGWKTDGEIAGSEADESKN